LLPKIHKKKKSMLVLLVSNIKQIFFKSFRQVWIKSLVNVNISWIGNLKNVSFSWHWCEWNDWDVWFNFPWRGEATKRVPCLDFSIPSRLPYIILSKQIESHRKLRERRLLRDLRISLSVAMCNYTHVFITQIFLIFTSNKLWENLQFL